MTSTPTRPPVDPEVDGRPMSRLDRWRGRLPKGRMRWVVGPLLVLVAVAIVAAFVYSWWLGGGLLKVTNTVQDRADIVQNRLDKFEKAVKAGDEPAARRHLRVAQGAIDEARSAADVPQVRIAKLWPYTRGTVSDLDHLLNAASVIVGSAEQGLTLYTEFSGDRSNLFADGKVNLDALVKGRDALTNVTEAMDRAQSELRKVKGDGPLGSDALDSKKSGLKQIRGVQAQLAPFAPFIAALPDALGAAGTKRYFVAVMNPAEMRASGGAPLSMALVKVKDGEITIPVKGTTSSNYVNSPEGLLGDSPNVVWKRAKGDPFQPPPGQPQRFVNTGFNPDFRMSGEQMMRATPEFFGVKTDGVIALDVVALANLLRVIGPVESDFGTLTADNLVDELLVKSYAEQGSDIVGRQARNDALMSTVLSQVMGGGNLRGKAEALLATAPSRHLQMYFRDPRLQQLALDRGVAGAIPTPKTGNLTAVYTQNGNGSKLDVFQKRTIDEVITLKEDGSATVRRTVRLDNPTPPAVGTAPDPKRGYTTRYATNLVISLMPPGAKITQQPTVDLASTVKKGVDQEGRTFAQAAVQAPPDGAAEVSWEYEVPHAAVKRGGSWRFSDEVAVQNTIDGFLLRMTVIAPDGWTVARVDDSQAWYLNGSQAFLQVGIGAATRLDLDVTPG